MLDPFLTDFTCLGPILFLVFINDCPLDDNAMQSLNVALQMSQSEGKLEEGSVFVDDINMPQTEFYGAQPPIELLRLFLDKKGLYERTEWQWKNIRDTTLVAAAAPPVGGRSPLTPRFSTHFNLFCVP